MPFGRTGRAMPMTTRVMRFEARVTMLGEKTNYAKEDAVFANAVMAPAALWTTGYRICDGPSRFGACAAGLSMPSFTTLRRRDDGRAGGGLHIHARLGRRSTPTFPGSAASTPPACADRSRPRDGGQLMGLTAEQIAMRWALLAVLPADWLKSQRLQLGKVLCRAAWPCSRCAQSSLAAHALPGPPPPEANGAFFPRRSRAPS
jgi:hypothetical protein